MKLNKRKTVLLILLMVGMGLLVLWSGSSTKGTITPKKLDPTAADSADKTLDGKHITLKYKSGYAISVLPAKDNNIELYRLSANTVYDKTLSVAVTTLPSGRYTDDSAFNLRRVQTENYRERIMETNYGPAHVMVRLDGTEQTVFLAREGKLLTLAFVTFGDLDKLPAEVDAVVMSLQWK